MTTLKRVNEILKNRELVPAHTRGSMKIAPYLRVMRVMQEFSQNNLKRYFTLLAAVTFRFTSITMICNIASASCTVDKQWGCPTNQVCMSVSQHLTECRAIQPTPKIKFFLPFDSHSEVICTHSSGIGSHSWPNAFYSLDLATAYTQPASTVRASADGKAFLFSNKDGELCPEPPGYPDRTPTDLCGQGWGNHIKILHDHGYYSFYVHLKNFLIKNGESVKAGQPIGTEGATGLAGHRHLHWSVQKLPGNSQAEWEEKISWDGESVPFNFEANMDGKNITLDSATIKCAHANIGQGPSDQQPRLKGTYRP